MPQWRLAALVGLAVAASAGAALAQRAPAVGGVSGVVLAPHVALYNLSLGPSKSGSSVVDLRGRLAIEVSDLCDGFAVSQRIRMDVVNTEGGEVTTDFSLTGWEGRDGLRYRFSLTNDTGGRRVEEYVGQARLGGRGKGGKATLERPPGMTVDLPPGTIFPTEHLALVVSKAKAGQSIVAAKVFDGAGEDGLYDVNGVITPAAAAENKGPVAAIKGLRAWRVRMAYFPMAKAADQPEYEVGFRLFENGVSDQLLIDYGDFAMKGELVRLDLSPKPSC